MNYVKSFKKWLLPNNIRKAIEFYAACNRKENKKKPSKKLIEKILQESGDINLELGATKETSATGSLTIDIDDDADIWCDLAEDLPFPDNSISKIYSSHVLEHFSYFSLLHLLTESKRILKENGEFRACVPNARLYIDAIDAYVGRGDKFEPESFFKVRKAYHGNGKIDYINYIAYLRKHPKYMFDEENIVNILKRRAISMES